MKDQRKIEFCQAIKEGTSQAMKKFKKSYLIGLGVPDPKGIFGTTVDLKKQLPCAAYLKGEYGVNNLYAGVPVIIGSKGVEKIVELKLDSEEKKYFDKSIEAVNELFHAAKKIDSSLK